MLFAMGKTANCTPADRKAILELHKTGLSYKQISNQLNCSKKKVFDALKYFRTDGTLITSKEGNDPEKLQSKMTGKS